MVSWPGNLTSVTSYLQYANTATGDLFWTMITFGIWIVVFVYLYRTNILKTFTASSLITTIWAGLIWVAGIGSIETVLITSICTAIGAVLIFATNSSGG
jgi:hypothetical protein